MTATAAAQSGLNLLDPNSLLSHFGALGVFLVLFAETGLLIGFFLPGDSLLFTAGLLCATSATSAVHLSLATVLPAAVAGAVLGAQTGYLMGARVGPRLLDRPERPRLQQAVTRSRGALHRYGPAKAVVLARFIPLVRTVLNPLAGTIGLPARSFTLWQVVGGVLWAVGVTLAGYLLGSSVPNIDRYLLPLIAVVVAVSLIPVALEVRRSRSGRPARSGGASRSGPSSRSGRAAAHDVATQPAPEQDPMA